MNPLLFITLSSIAGGLLGLAIGYVWFKAARWIKKRREDKEYPPQTIGQATLDAYAKTSLFNLPPASLRSYGLTNRQIMQALPGLDPLPGPVELEETWTPEKIEAWRVIPVRVDLGDPDGLWLGFPHPDGPTEPVVTPLYHPVSKELKAVCRYVATPPMWPGYMPVSPRCGEPPGENCNSQVGYGCGFYAYKTREQAEDLLKMDLRGGCSAIARVHLSGKVIEHEGGYRAEILEVLEVEAPPAPPPFSPPRGDSLMALLQTSRMVPSIKIVNLPSSLGGRQVQVKADDAP